MMTSLPRRGAIVLAGGQSLRFGGRNKAFLPLGGVPLIERVLTAIQRITSDIWIVSREPQLYAHLPVCSVQDDLCAGPLGGLYTGLRHSVHDVNLVVGCDMPFLNSVFIEYMLTCIDEHDAIIPRVGQYTEPLCSLYRKSCLPSIEGVLQLGDLAMQSFLPLVSVKHIEGEIIQQFDPTLRLFMNINRPGDLQIAEEALANGRSGVQEHLPLFL